MADQIPMYVSDTAVGLSPGHTSGMDHLYPLPMPAYMAPRALTSMEQGRVGTCERLQFFLATAPTQWDHRQANGSPGIAQFRLPDGESISCILWNGLYHISGTDIVRALAYRFEAFGRPVRLTKKWEEGVFSDLRNLKPGIDATLEEPKSALLDYLFRNGCIRTQKKVFYWFSVLHDRLFMDALERDLKREKAGHEPTTATIGEPALSFRYDPRRGLYEQFASASHSITVSPFHQPPPSGHDTESAFPPSLPGPSREHSVDVPWSRHAASASSLRIPTVRHHSSATADESSAGAPAVAPPPSDEDIVGDHTEDLYWQANHYLQGDTTPRVPHATIGITTSASDFNTALQAGAEHVPWNRHMRSRQELLRSYDPTDNGPSRQLDTLTQHDDLESGIRENGSQSNEETKSFTCPFRFCSKAFRRLEHLKRHVRTHTQEKPFSCSVCSRGFSRQDNLLQHLRVHKRHNGSTRLSSESSVRRASNHTLSVMRHVSTPPRPFRENATLTYMPDSSDGAQVGIHRIFKRNITEPPPPRDVTNKQG